jgi:hypothetical protein
MQDTLRKQNLLIKGRTWRMAVVASIIYKAGMNVNFQGLLLITMLTAVRVVSKNPFFPAEIS